MMETNNPPEVLGVPPRPQQPRKRSRSEHKPAATTDIAKLREQISAHKKRCQSEVREIYRENLAELFFLQHGLNLIDFPQWRKKPNQLLASYLQNYALEAEETVSQSVRNEQAPQTGPPHAAVSQSVAEKLARTATVSECSQVSDTPNKTEAIVEQAKKEAEVIQRYGELRKQGLWSQRRLPKVQEPLRPKAHWDYLIEEMQWLAADFAQERKWKRAGCRKISKMIMKYHQERLEDERRAEKEGSFRLKRIAGQLAKQIKDFWSNVEKVVQYKMDSRLDEKRRQVMDTHLNFIVGQTEKYSSWLTEGLTQPGTGSVTESPTISRTSSTSHLQGDGEFEPSSDSADDEETIAREEHNQDQGDTNEELSALQAESEMPLEDLLKMLPSEILEHPVGIIKNQSQSDSESSNSHSTNQSDQEFNSGGSESDDEMTLAEQEQVEQTEDRGDNDVQMELDELRAENEMSVEELAAKYAGAYASDFDLPDTPSSSEAEDGNITSEESDSDSETDQTDGEQDNNGNTDDAEEVGIDYLLHPEKDEDEMALSDGDGPGKGIRDIAAAAQSFQPTGYTLETTSVKTPVPFLLKHTLREYQHVGLDWLATMYDKKLNGILADEMGLGKTIQTIAVLAHLACQHEVWGPHLIVVPTSVMLNWEMEIKKWCPAFKILTYYGSPKERKLKRVGWTKTNAFHICITSYKLVIQDHIAFRRKKWKYLILDEAQNIKNFKSQRWQTLLNFSSQRRLLLTGTPLQNNLMELWSLMHFLMPNVFQSHFDFKEWFSNPLTGMIEGNTEYNEQLIRRLHKVLRPFLLRRLKADVEKQLPKKYEHVVMCKLSKRQRFLYDEFMSRKITKETLESGNFMSVINILMQLRKVCNHPDMFDPRPIISPFETENISIKTANAVLKALDYHPLEKLELTSLYPSLAGMELQSSAYSAHRSRQLQTPPSLIEVMSSDEDACRPPPTKLRPFVIRSSAPAANVQPRPLSKLPPKTVSVTSSVLKPGSPASSQSSAHNTNATSSTVKQAVLNPKLTSLALKQGGVLHLIQTSTGQTLITSAANVQALSSTLPNSKVIPVTTVMVSSSANTTQSSVVTQSKSVSSTAGSNPTTSLAGIDPVTGRPVLRVLPQHSTAVNNVEATTATTTNTSGTVTSSGLVNGAKPVVTSTESVTPTPSTAATRTTSLIGPASRKRALEKEAKNKYETELKLEVLESREENWRKNTLERIVKLNKKHCTQRPVYGFDLHDAVDVWRRGYHMRTIGFNDNSCVNCRNASLQGDLSSTPYIYNRTTNALKQLIRSSDERLNLLSDILERFVFYTPPVKSSLGSRSSSLKILLGHKERSSLRDAAFKLHPIQTRMLVQFPEKRLIQYDCGKLQTLDLLLRELKQDHHRVLIFTQMTKMLDVLESFLSFHGHRYLRLDGTTGVEKRQMLMDRFNADKRIFVFILSTRSGGIGVNLTGADTVVFYDSDWNPTMDAQAQDRCHRIGQTRDVHIYRLISEKTIEENILKKANQKRLLGDVAIEGGNFTTATLQKNTINDLFAEPSGLEQLVRSSSNTLSTTEDKTPIELPSSKTKQLEQALGAAEDAEDVAATHMAQDEVSAELAEFDENIPWDERENELRQKQQESSNKVEREIALIEKELTAVERYAVKFLESTDDQFSEDAIKEAEEEIEDAKRNWELNRLKEQRKEEERLAENEEDEMLFTYSTEDHVNKVFKDSITGENMPMWCPPTPPREDTDVYYTDHSIGFLYDSAVMSESSLPPIYVKKERKRKHVIDYQMHSIKPKKRMLEEVDGPPPITTHISSSHRPPRSLFDRPSNKFKRDKQAALHKHSSLPSAYAAKLSAAGLSSGKPHIPEPSTPDAPEWLIHEDWSLLQAVQQILQLPLTLSNQSPAHTPNWDLVSETVSTVSRIYRSPKQCKYRYESYIIPKEEGKLIYDPNPARNKTTSKKQQKLLQKTKMKPMKVGQQYANDGGSSVTTLHAFRFDCIKNVASKRAPSMRPTLVNPLMRNPRHAAVLQENGIHYDQPMTPEEVAKVRQERINDEKKRAKEQQLAQQQRAVLQQATRAASNAPATQQQILQQIPVSATGQAQILVSKDSIVVSRASLVSAMAANQHSNLSAKSGLASVAGVSSITRTLPGSIVVSNNASNFSAINKRLNSSNTTSIVGLSQVAQQSGSSNTTNIATARRLSMQEIQRSSQYNQTQLVRQMQSTSQSLSGASAVIGSPRTITVQQQPTHLAAISGPGKTLNLLRHQVQQARAGGTIVQRPVGISQTGIRTTTTMAKGTGAITSLPIQSSKSGTTGSEIQQQLLKQKIQVSLNPQNVATTVASASGQPQTTFVKTVNASNTLASQNVTIPVSGSVNINVSIAQQSKAGLQGAAKATLTNQPTQLRQIQLLKGATPAIARPQQKIGLTAHQLMGKSGQASVQILQTENNKQLAQKLSRLFKPQVAGSQIQQIITAPTSALTGSNTIVTSAGSQITPGQTIIATTQLITPPNMQATITKMSTGQSNLSNVSNVTVSLARPAVTSTSAVTIVPTSSVTQASLVNQSPMKTQTLTGGRITTNLTQRQHVATIGPSTGGTHTSASSIVTLTQPSVSASLMNKTIIGGSSQSLTQQHKPTVTPTITPTTHTTHTAHQQHSSMDVTDVPASSITIVSQTKPAQRTQLVESLITNRTVSETLSKTVSETRQSVSDSISRPSIERTVSETISRTSAESLINPSSQQPITPATQQLSVTTTVPAPSPAVATTVTTTPGAGSQTSQIPDSTRTYAMRPRKQT